MDMTGLAREVFLVNRDKGLWDDVGSNSTTTHVIARCGENVLAVGLLVEHISSGMSLTSPAFTMDHLSPAQVKVLSKLVLIVTNLARAIDTYVNDPLDTTRFEGDLVSIHLSTFDIEGYINADVDYTVLAKNIFNKG